VDASVGVTEDEVLRRVATRVLREKAAHVVDVERTRLVRGDGQGLGVYRVSGVADVAGERRPWSAILKVLPADGGERPDHWSYPQREVLAYRSGLVTQVPEGLGSPAYVTAERDDAGRHHLWLEDLGTQDEPWTIDDYAWAARRLGRFNGAYLSRLKIPQRPWLSRDWLRGWLAATAESVAALPAYGDHPVVRRVYPPELRRRMAELWADGERLLRALDRLPQTLCHNDAFRRNLARRGDRLLGLDWAFMGHAPVGADLSPLISATFAFAEVAPGDRAMLEDAAVSAYLQGLADTGWRGVSDEVWLAYTATSALRYGPGTVRIVLPTLLDDPLHDHVAEVLGMPFDAVLDHWAAVIAAEIGLHARARRLLA